MAKTYPEIDADLERFIHAQRLFFVGSAPLSAEGHVNVSPKGLDALRILGPRRVAYLDLTGSGAETIAHLRENGRIVLMFCAFQGPPRIVRLHGRGSVIPPGEQPDLFPDLPGARAVVEVELDRISDSCGYGVPLMEFVADRPQMAAWVAKKERSGGIGQYRDENNSHSIDGLPALEESAYLSLPSSST
ncbi:MAG TPA: pyridoxamine 5'-phosphate oxidase family protein [Candidatus Acidoferrales bacterium]|nr:pyridoxamine 5'-phosphate oxidase family protein [Candidatus Acidoferrales bacterium]